MMLLVDLDGERWIADVGFGAQGLLLPVPLRDAREARQYAWAFRVVAAGGVWILQTRGGRSWDDLYEFSLEPQIAADYEMASHYTSTHPASRFTQTLTAQRIAPEVRCVLRNREYSEDRGTGVIRRTLADDAEILQVLGDVFGLRFPAGTRFPFRSTAA
jgi:N-hydroxyarylamine O-acetyltransferase